MEFSNNKHTQRISRRERERRAGIQGVIQGLQATERLLPHSLNPGDIGAVAIQPDPDYFPDPEAA